MDCRMASRLLRAAARVIVETASRTWTVALKLIEGGGTPSAAAQATEPAPQDPLKEGDSAGQDHQEKDQASAAVETASSTRTSQEPCENNEGATKNPSPQAPYIDNFYLGDARDS